MRDMNAVYRVIRMRRKKGIDPFWRGELDKHALDPFDEWIFPRGSFGDFARGWDWGAAEIRNLVTREYVYPIPWEHTL